MRARLNDVVTTDVDTVWEWVPADPAEVYYPLEMTIGTAPGRGDLFQALVVTPEALLARRTSLDDVLDSRSLIVVLDYSWAKVEAYVERVLDVCTGDTWEEVVAKLTRHFSWEYDDYRVV